MHTQVHAHMHTQTHTYDFKWVRGDIGTLEIKLLFAKITTPIFFFFYIIYLHQLIKQFVVPAQRKLCITFKKYIFVWHNTVLHTLFLTEIFGKNWFRLLFFF